MNLTRRVSETRIVSIARTLLMLVSVAPIAVAQLPAADIKAADQKPADAYQTFYLTNVAHPGDASELLTDLRNMLSPGSKAYYTPSQNAVSIRATPEEMLLARKIISDLDRAKKAYRLTYTITEVDGGKRAEARHVSLIVLSGEKAEVKQGDRVPIITGSFDSGSSKTNTQVQYVDTGLTIEATLEPYGDGFWLRTKVEQSGVADEKSTVGLQDPVVRQTTLEETSILGQGKPLVLGSLDIPGTTRHQEVEVVSELLR